MTRRTRQLQKHAPLMRNAVVLARHAGAEALEHRMLLSAALSWVPGPSHLAVAPDHAIWYSNGGTLTRRDADGSLSLYTLPSMPGAPAPEVTSDIVFTGDS